MTQNDTIAAIATGNGGAVAIVRLSGTDAIGICDSIFESAAKKLADQKGFTLHYGYIKDGDKIVDDVLVSIFRAPRSYTGEDMVEISCHGSSYIKSEILNLCIREGARSAMAGEFTMRAFLNGKMDLSQAEAVADIIAAESRAAHAVASNQMRGVYSSEFNTLRDKLIEISSLLELELDFSEEDVEFADRTHLLEITDAIGGKIGTLLASFKLGNIIKNGLPVAIVGSPNVGKSTLLNALLGEDKALVSNIAGTTRDTIEDTLNIGGTTFRFIDTAGIRQSSDLLENMGIERTLRSMEKASVILLVVDPSEKDEAITDQLRGLKLAESQTLAVIINKADKARSERIEEVAAALRKAEREPVRQAEPYKESSDKAPAGKAPVGGNAGNAGKIAAIIPISAKRKENIEDITDFLTRQVDISQIDNSTNTIVYNTRHYNSLLSASEAVERVREAMRGGIPGDLLSQDVHDIIYHISAITGAITNEDILGSIFSKFCVGK